MDAKSNQNDSDIKKNVEKETPYHWTRLRFYRSRYDSWSKPHNREAVNIGEIRKFANGRTSIVCKSWQNKDDEERVQLATIEASPSKQQAILSLIQRIEANPGQALTDLNNSPVTEGQHSHEIKVKLTTGFKTMKEKTKTLLEWSGNAMFINGGLLGEIAVLLGDEKTGTPEPLQLPDGRKAIFDGEMNLVEDVNHGHRQTEESEEIISDMWLDHYNNHKHDWWRVRPSGIPMGLSEVGVLLLITLQRHRIDWRAELTQEEVIDAETTLADTLDYYDYKPK